MYFAPTHSEKRMRERQKKIERNGSVAGFNLNASLTWNDLQEHIKLSVLCSPDSLMRLKNSSSYVGILDCILYVIRYLLPSWAGHSCTVRFKLNDPV